MGRKYIEEDETEIEPVYHRALIFTSCAPGEVDINLSGQGLDDDHVKLFMESLVMTNCDVHRLKLAGNKIGNAGAEIIAENMKLLPALTHLHLAGNGIED